jgi:hypothetical protein
VTSFPKNLAQIWHKIPVPRRRAPGVMSPYIFPLAKNGVKRAALDSFFCFFFYPDSLLSGH